MISVIIPVFNKKNTLAACLESILSNEYKDKEIIAIDDNSQDGSSQILRQFAERGIIVIELEEHCGISCACNTGLVKARGDIIVRTDADTVVPKDWLKRFAEHFADPEVIAVGGASFGCLNESSIIARTNSLFVKVGEVLFRRTSVFGRLPGVNRAVRKSVLQSSGGFSHACSGCEDRDLFFRIKGKGKIIFDPTILIKTEFPSTLRELWERKFSWGENEEKRINSLIGWRCIFSLSVLILTIFSLVGALLGYFFSNRIALLALCILIMTYAVILLFGYLVSRGERKRWPDLLCMPAVFAFSELAFSFGLLNAVLKKIRRKRYP